MRSDKVKTFGIPFLVFVAMFVIWEWSAINSDIPEFLFPRPSAVTMELYNKFPFFLGHLAITLKTAVIGYFIANTLSFITAVIFVHSRKMELAFYPYVIGLKIAPMLALSPFVVLLLGIGVASKVAIVTLICFFPFLVNTVKGLRSVDQEALDVFRSLSASKWQIFVKLRLPNSLPYVFPALKITSTLAMTGSFVGEFIASNKGIGHVILLSTRTLDTTTAFAAIILTVLTGIGLFVLVDMLERKIIFWQRSE